jgi:hypothetical protein
MQKIFAPLAIGFIALTSCNGLKEQKPLTTDQVHAIEEGIPKIIPTVTLINTRQGDDHSKLKIILGDPTFYNANDDEKRSKAIEVGKMVLQAVGVENTLSEGKLVITKDVKNQSEDPADGISLDMKLDSLNNELYKK